jgi:FlaA1/EpsC-like NDP-sugar epimerase
MEKNMPNKDFLNNTVDGFLECLGNKKLILFGAGEEMRNALSQFRETPAFRPAYAVDNDFRMWYSRYLGYEVHAPEVLNGEDKAASVILITSLYAYRIKEQLERMGMVHYYSSHLFIESKIDTLNFLVRF